MRTISRLGYHFRAFEYALYGDISDSLLVVESMCGKALNQDSYRTGYVRSSNKDGLFVFGLRGSCGKKAEAIEKMSLREKITYVYFLIKAGFNSFVKTKGKLLDKFLLFLEWFNWIFSFQWINNYYLEKKLSEPICAYNIEKIGCVHEMHSYARVVWRVAA